MAYTLSATFWTFSKRKNSTKRPATSGTVFNYCLKDVTSVLSPTLEIHDASVLVYNYCYLQQFGRYYWVGDKRSIAYNTYEVDLEVDVPGSWGADTYGQSVMAQMSASFYDDELDDERIQPTDIITPVVHASKTLDVFPATYQIEKMFSIVTGSGSNFGGLDIFTHLDTVGNVLSIIDALFDADNWQVKLNSVLKIDPLQIIRGMWAVPFDPAQCHGVSQASRTIALGLQNPQTINGALLDGPYVERHRDDLALPLPTNQDFRFSDRFVKYYCNIPFLGVVNIPTALAKSSGSLHYEYAADCVSGMYTITLYCGGVCLGTWSTNLKSEFSLASQGSQAGSVTSGAVMGAATVGLAGATAGGWKAALIGGIAGAATGGFRGALNTPEVNVISQASGSLAPAAKYTRDLEVYLYESDENVSPATFAATVGRPTQKVVQLASGIGYIQTANASVSFSGYRSEIDAMNALLDGGVYYE